MPVKKIDPRPFVRTYTQRAACTSLISLSTAIVFHYLRHFAHHPIKNILLSKKIYTALIISSYSISSIALTLLFIKEIKTAQVIKNRILNSDDIRHIESLGKKKIVLKNCRFSSIPYTKQTEEICIVGSNLRGIDLSRVPCMLTIERCIITKEIAKSLTKKARQSLFITNCIFEEGAGLLSSQCRYLNIFESGCVQTSNSSIRNALEMHRLEFNKYPITAKFINLLLKKDHPQQASIVLHSCSLTEEANQAIQASRKITSNFPTLVEPSA